MTEPDAPEKPKPQPFLRHARNTFLAGLAAVIPVGGTIWVLVLVYKALQAVGRETIKGVFRFLNWIRGEEGEKTPWAFLFDEDHAVWMLIPFVILFGTGYLVTNRFGGAFLSWLNRSMMRVPGVGMVYSAFKQLVDALRGLGGERERKFRSVAYIEYPSPGCRLIGFVTGEYHDPQTGKEVTSVFIPTSPNPMTGFTIVMDDERVVNSDMTLEEGMKMVLSAGLVSPESFTE